MISTTMPPHIVTRFAPSPTGRLHIGHGWSALMAHDRARKNGGVFRLRIEDIDGARSREEHVTGIIEDLAWLGITWDGEVVRQSDRLPVYAAALDRLKAMGLVYPCFCTRADIAASASAPHGPEGAIYPGTCRALPLAEQVARFETTPCAWRIDMAKAVALVGRLTWEDAGHGTILADPLGAGDVVLARKDAPTSYHLAATVDDAAMKISFVLRGRDLMGATDIHRLLQALLDLPTPLYRHHSLLIGPDGKRLAKRSGGIQLAEMRDAGVDPARLRDDLRRGVFPVGISVRDT
ncbi:tRNA glutamyl-Q(34) synthetase GluQRS [Sphingobium sp. SCG-1]|uniref:tRNA glutamyl-Q(34) synthetase GluQRS n=1 Tax=Sphingobium sp. SCG-1 TaxID=2072936 RepID=UPI000CD6AFB6|nr:tRNA glutamyl-Q(34) synthetase GluQRS [Sphingobium sp. SCG-1]AUW59537.1 tRNA glutamyl-Q(34) synthetase GluQRS [Sphingobium sp. SCG-1]